MMFFISRTILEIFVRVMFKVRFYGQKNVPDAPYIIVPNHTSLVDPPLAALGCRKDMVHFLAKKELFDPLVLGAWSRSVGCIEVDRDAKSPKSLKTAIKLLQKGHVVCIFPEGTRSEDGSLQAAKRGVGFLIATANVPVVPIYIEGSKDALSKGGKMNPGAPINVYVGKPVPQSELTFRTDSGKKDYEKIANCIMDHIASAKETWNS